MWIHISIGVCIRVANPHIKENRSLLLPQSPSNYNQPCIRGLGCYIQLFSCDALQKLLRHTVLSSSASRSLSSLWRHDKYDPFAYHSVIHMSPQTQTEGVSGTSQSYLSFRASQNSLLFKLDAPFWVARSTAVNSQSFSRNRALHLIKVPSSLHSLFVLHLEHLMLHNTCKVRISLSSSLCQALI